MPVRPTSRVRGVHDGVLANHALAFGAGSSASDPRNVCRSSVTALREEVLSESMPRPLFRNHLRDNGLRSPCCVDEEPLRPTLAGVVENEALDYFDLSSRLVALPALNLDGP